MKNRTHAFIVITAIFAMLTAAAPAAFTVSGRQLLLDGQPFQVRGVCYQPTPVGQNPSAASPYGDYFTSGYSALWARDLPLMRQMGANVVRVYSWDPTADHTAFLDACYNNGVNPIYILINRWIDPATSWTNSTAVNLIKTDYLNIDHNLSNHVAVLGLALGNETNNANGNGTNSAFWSAVNTVATAVKAQNSARLLSMAVTDALSQVSSYNSTMTALDFWCVQVYRGTSFGTFFSSYNSASGKPLIVSEYGIDAFNNGAGSAYPSNAAIPASAIAGLWTEIAANSSTCAGGCVFEFADEWWKASGSASTHDNGGAGGGSTDNFLNEEWFGLYAITDTASPNTLTARAAVAALTALWPIFTTQPTSQTVAAGANLSFTAATNISPAPAFQWQLSTDGTTWINLTDTATYSGTTTGTLTLAAVISALHAYQYRCVATSGTTSLNSSTATLTLSPYCYLSNLSVRAAMATGQTLIVGFVVNAGAKPVLVRAAGPALNNYGLTGVADPSITLFNGGTVVATNDNWSTSLVPTFVTLGAFAFDSGSKDAALLQPINGPHTSQAVATGAGAILVEAYDAGPSDTRKLVNLSTRFQVGTGDNILIAGFVISGTGTMNVLVRAVGPTLASYGVTGVLGDPQLAIYDGGTAIATNDNWSSSLTPTFDTLGAFRLVDASKDAAMVVTLQAGKPYTAQVSGVGGTTGEALVEIYAIP